MFERMTNNHETMGSQKVLLYSIHIIGEDINQSLEASEFDLTYVKEIVETQNIEFSKKPRWSGSSECKGNQILI